MVADPDVVTRCQGVSKRFGRVAALEASVALVVLGTVPVERRDIRSV